MTFEELAAAGVSSTMGEVRKSENIQPQEDNQFLTLSLILKIVRRGRSDPRVHLVLKKILQMLMLTKRSYCIKELQVISSIFRLQ
jgi:hypothetical protein